MKATIFPEADADGKQRVTVGGIVLGYIMPQGGWWTAISLSGQSISFEAGIVDAVRAVVAFSYPQLMIEVVEEEA
jgi:hypothetical protein